MNLSLEIPWGETQSVRAGFANHMLVQSDTNEVYLTFVEVVPPPIVEGMTVTDPKVQLNCVAKVVLPASRLETIANALNDVVATLRSRQQEIAASQNKKSTIRRAN